MKEYVPGINERDLVAKKWTPCSTAIGACNEKGAIAIQELAPAWKELAPLVQEWSPVVKEWAPVVKEEAAVVKNILQDRVNKSCSRAALQKV